MPGAPSSFLFLVANLAPTSKAPVTTSVALVTSVFSVCPFRSLSSSARPLSEVSFPWIESVAPV